MKKALLILMIIQFTMSFAAEEKNVQARQEGNRTVISYDLVGTNGEDADVTFTVEYQGKKYTQKNLSLRGDYGKVVVGENKKIYWDVLKDFPEGLTGTVEWFLNVGGNTYKDPITGMEFVLIKGGCYQMGSDKGASYEKPIHEVCIDDFYIGKYEVTQAQWKSVMENNPSYFKQCGDDCPVEQVSWQDANDFINKLNGLSSVTFRLPTEAEWEYAAKSGDDYSYSGSDDVDSVAWYLSNSGRITHEVGQKLANRFGLYDMSGNVWEWVDDIYNEKAYKKHQRNNPKYTKSGTYRVDRGGSVLNNAISVRSALRGHDFPDTRNYLLGFRLSITPPFPVTHSSPR